MSEKNHISIITRRNISDSLMMSNISYNGRLNEPEFLYRLYDLKKYTSNDHRYKDAGGDIFKHIVINIDWQRDWIISDGRFNLIQGDDEEFLKFLCETIHPAVRMDQTEVLKILEIYNSHLSNDGFEIIPVNEKFGKAIYKGCKRLRARSFGS